MFATNPPFDFSDASVLVVGDLMLDRFRYGSVSRISPEAPVPVLHAKRETHMLGGAGNVLANIAALGARCGLVAVVGDDSAGTECVAILRGFGIDADRLVVAPGRKTTVKTRFISGSQQLLRCDDEDVTPMARSTEDALIARFDEAVESYRIVALSDYCKGVLSDRLLTHILDTCLQLGKPVVVDPKRKDFGAYAGATYIKPNRAELSAFAGLSCHGIDECEAAAQAAAARTGAAILLTMSEDGMALFRPGQPRFEVHATASDVYDVSGAGDTALAIFCVALSADSPVEDAVTLANVGAGIAVRKLGTATISLADLSRGMADAHALSVGAICSRSEARKQVEAWKRDGVRVGFTNGCFDIVHAGHIELLRQARATCDRLVVGMNSDQSVARLKGSTRPIQPQSSRASVLAAIDAVDLVVIFDEDTPLDLIDALRPTDLIKGADYTEDQVVGASIVKAEGGRVHLVPLVPGLSTTNAVRRIEQGSHRAGVGAS